METTLFQVYHFLLVFLIIIYGLSAGLCMRCIVEASDYSEVAKNIGKDQYIINGFFVSLIPVINTLNGGEWFYKRVLKKQTKEEYHTGYADD